jgi:hypothetical protein
MTMRRLARTGDPIHEQERVSVRQDASIAV